MNLKEILLPAFTSPILFNKTEQWKVLKSSYGFQIEEKQHISESRGLDGRSNCLGHSHISNGKKDSLCLLKLALKIFFIITSPNFDWEKLERR